MYQREFDQKLKVSLPKAVLFYGSNSYMVEFYINHYIKKTDAKDSMLQLTYDEWNFDKAKSFLLQSSLFGGTDLLVIKSDKKIPKKELDILIDLANKRDGNYVLFSFMGEDKSAKSMQSSFSEKKGGIWVRFFEPSIGEGVAMLQQKAQEIRLDIDHYALQHLMLILNNNLAMCINELSKLAILGTKISSKDIDRLVYSSAPLATEQLLIDLFNKKPVTDTVSKLLDLGEDEFSLLRSTQYFVNQIFLFHAYIKLNGYVNSADILGYKLPKQIEDQKAQLALKVKSSSILKIFEHLLDSEISIKKANTTQKEALIYSIFIKLQSYL